MFIQVTQSSPMFGLDGEFVLTQNDKMSLACISIVNEAGELVYHTLVKPKHDIKDYLTRFSGMTKSKIKSANKTLQDVQDDIRQYLPPDAILVGHSLQNDLKVMEVSVFYINTLTISGRFKCVGKAISMKFMKNYKTI